MGVPMAPSPMNAKEVMVRALWEMLVVRAINFEQSEQQ